MHDITYQDMRNALSKFATGVTIVTACDAEGGKVGMTASSFNSVSMDPPLILWSVRKNALSAETFKTTDNFSVHILSAGQKELSNQFARSGFDKFSDVEHSIDQNNVPLLTDALVRFDCKTWAVYEGGDHWIIVGRVQDLTTTDGDGLVFCNGFYTTTAAIPETNT